MLQEQVDWYESWFGSPYYHILYQDRDLEEAREFVDKLIAYLQPMSGSKMADIACGEGRFARQLAKYGFDVTGIDLAYESIQVAKKYEADNLHFLVHDMRFPFYINYFDFAFNFFTSFGYFEHQRHHEMAAKSFAKCLKPGGILVVDYLNREKALANLVTEESITKGGIDFHIEKKLESDHFVKQISFKDEDGDNRVFTETVAAFTLGDFIAMFKKAGLSMVANFGDYQLNNYHPQDSPRMIMVFKK